MGTTEHWGDFRADFPKDVVKALLRGAIACYPAAWEGSQGLSKSSAKYLIGHYRHALLRDTFEQVAERFSSISVTITPTTPPTTDFVELVSGQSILALASVQMKREVPRFAQQRASRAAVINYSLWESEKAGQRGYALLLCGPDVSWDRVKHVPAFIDIGIPAHDYSTYIEYRRLYDWFPGTVEEAAGVSPAEIRKAYLRMRRHRKHGSEEA